MSEKVVKTEVNEAEAVEEAVNEEVVINEEGLGKKILKWGLRGLALVATGVAGFLLGRATGNDDDNGNEDNSESNDDGQENEE